LSNELSFCQPFKWEVFDESNTLVKSVENLTSFGTQSIKNLSYNKTYTVKVTDKNGSVISNSNISYSHDTPSLGGHWASNFFPFTYNLFYDVTQICFPYKIEIYDENETLLTTVENINRNADTIRGLEYDKLYKIKIIDNSGSFTEFEHSEKQPDGDGGFMPSCDNYAIRVDKPVNIKTPFTWTVYDKDGKAVLSGDDNNNKISDLQYDTDYTVTFTDGVTTTTYAIPNGIFTLPAPGMFDMTERNHQCDNFELHFMAENVVCFPYKLEVSDSDGKITYSESNFMSPQYHSITIEYNKTYNIKVTDKNGIETLLMKDGYRLDREQSALNFQSSHSISDCVSESHKGYMYIYGQLDNGTRIRFLSGPQTPVHADTVLHESVYEFYPFSQDYRYSEEVVIETGDYVFEVAKCGDVRTVTIPYKRKLEARDFSYTMGEVEDPCSGKINIFPKGQVYSGENPEDTWFVMEECPVPELTGQTIRGNDPISYFSLSAQGKYVIGIRRYSHECTIETIVIDHGGEHLGLDGRSSYVCEIGTIGHIRVQVKNGKQPYTYTLQELNGTPVAGIEPNNTGAFDYGAFDEKYIVQVHDACGKGFPIEVQINTLDQTTLLSGNTVFCKDATIELSCLLLGATKYEWNGPLGFYADTRSISIPNVTPEHSGEYSILVEPAGCVGQSFPATIPVTVPDVPAPKVSDPYMACADASNRLSVQPVEGHSIQWYDANEEPLPDAPFINFNDGAEEYMFYVTQTNNAYGECASEKTKVNVISTPMPEKDATATGWSCENGNPEITVTNMVDGYVYSVFAGPDDADTIIAFHGTDEETMNVTLPTTVADNTEFYLQTATLAGCASDNRQITPIEVDKLYIEPDKLPQYSTNVDYEQTLITNALSPAFTVIGGELPDGLSLSLSGTISGKPSSSKQRTSAFTVQVVDEKGCKVTREYMLNGDAFVPKIFTPNGDDVNDVFMQGRKVVIFDRLGIEIFRGDNGWDGSYKGKLVAPDIYFYIVEYVDENSSDPAKILTGYVGVHY
jgi:gliding motility-associated-like protein